MPKTYGTVTTFTAGSVLTASQLNVAGTAVNNLVVPAAVRVQRTTDLTGYTSNTDIAWESEVWDTDDMFTVGTSATNITIKTAGLYAVSFVGQAAGLATITRILPRLFLNGTQFLQYETIVSDTATIGQINMQTVESFAVNDVVTARVAFFGGSAYRIEGAAAPSNENTRLTLTWIGRTS